MLKLISAKCPNCGATLKLSKEDEKTECEYCHNTIIVDDAIACYKLKVSGKVSVEGIETNTELIESANELLDMNEYLKAKRKFLEFSEKCPDNYQGWLGLLICRTRNFTIRDNNIMFENDINKYRNHFFRTAPNEIKEEYFEVIDKYFDPEKYKQIEEEERKQKESEAKEKEKEEKKKIQKDKFNKNKDTIIQLSSSAIGGTAFVLYKIWNVTLYAFGALMILASLITITDDFISSIFGILFGLSLLPILYKKIEEKFNISKKNIRIIKIVLPIILIIIFGITLPTDTTDKNETNNNSSANNNSIEEKENKKNKAKQKIIFLKSTKAKDYYEILCEVGKLSINKPSNIYEDINEYSSYNNNYMVEIGANKSTDEIAYITITTLSNIDPTNLFMSLNRLDYNGKDTKKLTSFIVDNIGKEAKIKIGDLNFSMWTNNGKAIIKAETPDFEKYIESK